MSIPVVLLQQRDLLAHIIAFYRAISGETVSCSGGGSLQVVGGCGCVEMHTIACC